MLQDYCMYYCFSLGPMALRYWLWVNVYLLSIFTEQLFLQGKIAISDVTVLSDIFSDVKSLDEQNIVQQSSND